MLSDFLHVSFFLLSLTAHGMFVGGLVYSSPIVLLAAIASLYVAWRNITGNILQDKGKVSVFKQSLPPINGY